MPIPVIEAIKAHIDLESEIGGYEAHHATQQSIDEAYEQAAIFLNTKPRNIALVANATDAFTRAISSIPMESGDVVITSEDDYISNQIAYISLKKRLGIELVRVSCKSKGGVDVEALEKEVVKHRPVLVALTHIPTNSGLIQDVIEAGEVCQRYEVPFLVDACQSVGQIPVDVQKIKCDFLSATMRKFLRGPRGAGFLYVSDNMLNKGYEPLFIDMRGAEWLEKDSYRSMETAQRFEDWEFGYALVHGSREAFRYANQWGMEHLSLRALQLASGLRSRLSEIDGVKVLDRGDQVGAIVTASIEGADSESLEMYLRENKINAGISLWHYATIDFEKKGVNWALRLAPHYFNLEEEVDQVVGVMKAYLSTKLRS